MLYILAVWGNEIPGDGYKRHRSISKNAILNTPVTDDGEINYDYMAAYIRVQEKLAIADAVRLKDRIIADTGRLVLGNDVEAIEAADGGRLDKVATDDAAVVNDAPTIRGLCSTCFNVTGIDGVRNQIAKMHHLDKKRMGDAVQHVDAGVGKEIDLTAEPSRFGLAATWILHSRIPMCLQQV